MLYTKPSGLLLWRSSIIALIIATFLLTGLSGCIPPTLPNIRSDIEARKVLRVGIQYAPSRYQIGPHGAQGFDYELISGLADYLDIELQIVPFFDSSIMQQALASQKIDLLVPLTTDEEYESPAYKSGPRYLNTAWQLNGQQDDSLQAAVFDYFSEVRQQNTIVYLKEKYLQPLSTPGKPDINALVSASLNNPSMLNAGIEKLDKKLSPSIVAALTFQLNRWEHDGSLTVETQRLEEMLAKVPAEIPEDQKIPMALAAFYSGLPHLLDARELTSRQGGNPNAWLDVQQRYPALENSDVYRHLKAGYVNGTNTVLFVSNVLDYQRAIQALEAQ